MCDPSAPRPREEFICKICSEVMKFDKGNIYKRTTSLPFGVKSACCGWHNHQPRCRWCDRKYLNARQAVDKVRAILIGLDLEPERLMVETYLKQTTIDVSHLSARVSHRVITAFVDTFHGARERPELFIKTGNGVRKVS
jgi:hypothetical protein